MNAPTFPHPPEVALSRPSVAQRLNIPEVRIRRAVDAGLVVPDLVIVRAGRTPMDAYLPRSLHRIASILELQS